MIEYKIYTFSECYTSIEELVNYQWNEVDERRKKVDLNVGSSYYLGLEKLGWHFVVIAEEEGVPLAYCSTLCSPDGHTSILQGAIDTIFCPEEVRGLGLGTEMIKAASEECLKRGAAYMLITFKNNVDHHRLVEDLGYFSYETVYCKFLGD